PGIDSVQDIEQVRGHAAGKRSCQHDCLVDGCGKGPKCVSLGGIRGLCFMDLFGDAEFEEMREVASDEFDRGIPPDSRAVNLPKRAVDTTPRLGLLSTA